jgi:hypothetical protein
MNGRPPDLIAEFDEAERLLGAIRSTRDAGIRGLEIYAPYPMADVANLLGYRTTVLWVAAVAAAIVGAGGTFYLQFWMNGIDYPLNVGGRPLGSWPALVPASLIVGILVPAAATLIGMLMLCGLPRLHHPVFDVPGFERASEDRFFLLIDGREVEKEPARILALLGQHGPLAIREVPS